MQFKRFSEADLLIYISIKKVISLLYLLLKLKRKKTYLLIIVIFFSSLGFIFCSNYMLKLFFSKKIWAHKINTVDRLNKAKTEFKGLELDVVFYNDSNYFDVNHPPTPSTNLSLKSYLSNHDKAISNQYWIDFKNLNNLNKKESSNHIIRLISEYKIEKSKIIVESTEPLPLKQFSNNSLKTAYYLPSNLRKIDSNHLRTELNRIQENITNNKPSYISSDYRNYLILKERFPKYKKLFWFTGYGSTNIFVARFFLWNILLDDNVDVLLIPFNE